MRILFVIDQVKTGGIETLLIKTVCELLRQGQEPVVISMARSGNLLGELEATGAKVRFITDNVKDLGFFKPTMLRCLRRVIREEMPDVLHLCDIISCHMGRLASLGLGVPVVCHLHSVAPHDKTKYRVMDGLLSFATDRYVSVSKAVESMRVPSCNWGKKPSDVLYNAVDADAVESAAPADLSGILPASGPVLVTAGRLVALKNLDLAIRAVSRLKAPFPDLSLLIVGDGPEREGLERLALNSDVAGSVIFAGFRRDVPSILKALGRRNGVFLMPSDYEGLPMSHVEALFCGLPAVISEHVPSREIAADASLVCETTVDDIADKLAALLSDPALYNRLAQAALTIAPKYSMERYVDNLLTIYEKIPGKGQR